MPESHRIRGAQKGICHTGNNHVNTVTGNEANVTFETRRICRCFEFRIKARQSSANGNQYKATIADIIYHRQQKIQK